MAIKGCSHGPEYLIPQPCADCERERAAEAALLKRISAAIDEKVARVGSHGTQGLSEASGSATSEAQESSASSDPPVIGAQQERKG